MKRKKVITGASHYTRVEITVLVIGTGPNSVERHMDVATDHIMRMFQDLPMPVPLVRLKVK